MTLLLVMIAAVMTVSFSRISLGQASRAIDADRRLQQRWGTISLEQAILPRAEKVLGQAEQVSRRPLVSCSRHIALGDQQFELVIADEQAKANAGAMLSGFGKRDAEARLQQLLGDRVAAGRIRLCPLTTRNESLRPIGSYAQVIEGVYPRELLVSIGSEHLADQLTCWGDGRVNVLRASERVLEAMLGRELGVGHIHYLVQLRDSSKPNLSDLLNQLDLTDVQRSQIEAKLTAGSRCYSLCLRTNGSHPVCRLVISEAEGTAPGVQRFEW
jgi:hypothetical protein